ncbi:MAG TPA: urate hydroxylase PuuD [Gemmatimonadales bacterium]|nr:urate hydroxylase PuuD [Gemmatimonadales bacterium]
MDAHLGQWLNLALRWTHVITGVAWTGTSFYFNWLNSRLAPPPPLSNRSEPGVAGELWSVHGGGFYRVVKYAIAPAHLPGTLHWFKWEAYATWLTGFLLLVLIYYAGAVSFLVEPGPGHLSPVAGVGVGVGVLVVSWLVYDALCRSRLGAKPLALSAVLFVLGTVLTWGLTRVLSPRAAYIHVGAAIGTIMAANVLMVIIPSQKEMVAAMAQGRSPDAARGKQAALRSLHNNYLTLPVLFIMVSSHYPATYGHPLNWAILAALAVIGVGTRHWFNLRNQGRRNVWLLPAAALGLVGLAFVTAPRTRPLQSNDGGGGAAFADVRVIVARRCAGCHSSAPTQPGMPVAPLGVMLDTPDQIRANAPRILAVAVDAQTMPLANLTGMTPDERELLGNWIRAGAPLR